MKSVLISIKPKYCELIANGKKTVEVRKTRPKIELPFKCYIYCTKDKEILGWHSEYKDNIRDNEHEYKAFTLHGQDKNAFNGKVIGEFVCDSITEIHYHDWSGDYGVPMEQFFANIFAESTCLNYEELHKYLQGQNGYGWNISDLVIYDKPKELGEFYIKCNDRNCEKCEYLDVDRFDDDYITRCEVEYKNPITSPPQSWCYVEELGV